MSIRMNKPGRYIGVSICCVWLILFGLNVSTATAQPTAHYELDPDWPQLPLPNRWLTGGLGGMCVDDRDHVFVLNRQNVVADDLDASNLAPPIIEFDPDGKVVGSWGNPDQLGSRLHDCHADDRQNLWIVAAGTGVVQKYATETGELLLQLGESGRFDSSDGTRNGQPLNSDSAQFFLPASVDIDSNTGDIYVADGELPGGNQRIAVIDQDGRFLRQWTLRRTQEEQGLVALPHCLRVSDDGMVYVCDRAADRIQVFDLMGRFIRNIDVSWTPVTSPQGRNSGGRGTAVVLAFSSDPEQRHLFVVNQNNVRVEVLDRHTGALITSFGDGPGRYRGQFTLPHGIGVDSTGNVYVAEQEGRRIQKFKLVSP